MATGGIDSVIIWQLSNSSILRHFQSQRGQRGAQHAGAAGGAGNYGLMGVAAPGSGQSANHPLEEGNEQRDCLNDLTWSNDSQMLGAAISDYIAIFDMNKLQQRAVQTGTNNNNNSTGNMPVGMATGATSAAIGGG